MAEERLEVPLERFDNQELLEARVAAAPPAVQGSLRTVLTYLYQSDGPKNLPSDRLALARAQLEPAEWIAAKWLQTRTNGSEKKNYGHGVLKAARAARLRCQACGFSDVRALNMDHVEGRVEGATFACLCANCHAIKSRAFDWSGTARQPPGALP